MDIQKLLGDFLGDGSRGHGSTPARRGSSSGSSLQDQIGGLLGSSGGKMAGGALAAGLASQLFRGKGMRKLGGSAVKLGGAAVVAGLAYKAYQSYQAKQDGTAAGSGNAAPQADGEVPSPENTKFLPKGREDQHAKLMLSSMIAAAKADGYIDKGEETAIFGKLDELDLSAEEKGYVMEEMRNPMSAAELAARADDRETAMDIYMASLLAIDPDDPAEKDYLDRLAKQLQLPGDLVSELHLTANEARG